jgi:hypothetical protein
MRDWIVVGEEELCVLTSENATRMDDLNSRLEAWRANLFLHQSNSISHGRSMLYCLTEKGVSLD